MSRAMWCDTYKLIYCTEQWCFRSAQHKYVAASSKSTYERGPSLVGLLGSSCQFTRILSCLGCFSRPSINLFPLIAHYFNSFVPITHHAGHAVVPDRLSLNICLFYWHWSKLWGALHKLWKEFTVQVHVIHKEHKKQHQWPWGRVGSIWPQPTSQCKTSDTPLPPHWGYIVVQLGKTDCCKSDLEGQAISTYVDINFKEKVTCKTH
jgi:hypothetical protein